jgi:hypothetical protein
MWKYDKHVDLDTQDDDDEWVRIIKINEWRTTSNKTNKQVN